MWSDHTPKSAVNGKNMFWFSWPTLKDIYSLSAFVVVADVKRLFKKTI